MANRKGRVTIPTDLDVVPQTKEIMERWGADALRDCDGTEFPQELKDTGAKIYATYCTTRKDVADRDISVKEAAGIPICMNMI